MDSFKFLRRKSSWLVAATVLGLGVLVSLPLFWPASESRRQLVPEPAPVSAQEPARPTGQEEKPASSAKAEAASSFRLDQLIFSPDCKCLVSLGRSLPKPEFGSWDDPLSESLLEQKYEVTSEIRVWSTTTEAPPRTLAGHEGRVLRTVFSPDSDRLIAACSGSKVGSCLKTWRVGTGAEGLTIRGVFVMGALAVSPDGKRLASAEFDQNVAVWDASSGAVVVPSKGVWGRGAVTGKSILAGYSPDGKYIAVVSVGQDSQKTPDGEKGGDGYVQLWEAEPIKVKVSANPWASFGKGQEGEKPTREEIALKRVFYSARVFGRVPTAPALSSSASAMAFLPDSKHLTLAGPNPDDSKVNESDRGAVHVQVLNLADGKVVASHSLQGHSGFLTCLRFSSDGRLLATSGSDRTIRVWNTESWQEVATLRGHSRTVATLAFGADGKQLFSACWDADRPAEVRRWDWEQGVATVLRK